MRNLLERCTDPACPACGCEQSETLKAIVRWGQATTRRRCEACGLVWNAPPPPRVKEEELTTKGTKSTKKQ